MRISFHEDRVIVRWQDGPNSVEVQAKPSDVVVEYVNVGGVYLKVENPRKALLAGHYMRRACLEASEGNKPSGG